MPSTVVTAANPSSRTRVINLCLQLFLALAIGFGYSPLRADSPPNAPIGLASPVPAVVELPHTDGYGLPAKPAPFTREEGAALFAAGKLACAGPCVTPFATLLGTADGADGHSNCTSTCINPEYSYLDLQSGNISVHAADPKRPELRYVGVTYQCVEYARKWWMKNKGITFGSINSAYEIIYLTEGGDIRSDKTLPLARSLNGTAKRPPKRGDLIIYYPDRDDPEWRHGHAAVAVAVDLEKGVVALAEENYDNRPWQDPQAFARRIQLFEVGGRYTLLDVAPGAGHNPDGGHIAGWIYPLPDE